MSTRILIAASLFTLLLTSTARAEDDGTIPGFDFPAVETTAKPGDKVFGVNRTMYDKLAAKADSTVIFYSGDLLEAGPKTSKFKSASKESVAPNSLIIAIPKGGSAKLGDTVIAPWGGGMMRALVVEAKNRKQPKVLFLDLDYDNPAKNKEGVGVAQQEETLQPDTFKVIGKPFDPGSMVTCKAGKDHLVGHLIRVAGDKALMLGHAGRLKAFAKADCTALDPKPKLKAGDKIFANFVGGLKPATVVKVDNKIGRVWVTFEFIKNKEYAKAFGLVAAKLP